MNRTQVYDFIGRLALALHSQGIQIKLSSLHHILGEAGVPVAEGRGKERGIGNRVSAAYRHWERKEPDPPVTAYAIASVYRDKDGSHAWKNYRAEDDE
ncbi:MAG: hypothetical protein AAGI52_01415 [Bacteroidota bacterium]